jgi:hypothetical protein
MKRTFTYMLIVCALFAACKPDCRGLNAREEAVIPDSVKVSVEVAKHYVKNYASHAGYVDSAAAGDETGKRKKPDTRCIWFSKERLSQLLCQLEKEEGDGVRFYIMTYNDTYTPDEKKYRPIPPPDHWGYNTLLMVSTKDSTAKGKVYHRDYYTDINAKMKTAAKPGFIVDLVPENRGEICPPPTNCEDTGATLIEN